MHCVVASSQPNRVRLGARRIRVGIAAPINGYLGLANKHHISFFISSAFSKCWVRVATPVCLTSELSIAIVHPGVAAGTIGGYLAFTNKGSRPCRLMGWPNLVAIQATGKTSTAVHVRTTIFGPFSQAVASVTIKPSERADAAFTGHDVPTGTSKHCPYHRLKVTPPDNTQSATISALLPAPALDIYMPACSKISISPVVSRAALYHE